MNWLFGLFGALVGVAVAEDRSFLGAVVGFFSVYLLLAVNGLRREVDLLRRDLATSKGRWMAESLAKRPEPATQPAAQPAAQSVPEAIARPPLAASGPAVSAAQSVRAPSDVAETAPAPTIEVARASAPVAPAEPGWEQKLAARIKGWFTEGNVPVKIGVLVLLFGVAAALKYAAAQGYFSLSIPTRLALIAGAGVLGLGIGWRERERRPAFGLSLQGGALGVLLLTVFAAYRLYELLPPGLAFALVVVIVAGSAALAVLQENMALAVLGFLGGYLAPVLISTGSSNPVGLFSYYAVLNAAVFAISWRQSWRLLNLVGFAFTFGVGAAWGSKFYRPELFASVEPFLILFFLFYIVIGLMYVIRQSEHRRPWVDGTLVFGTPLVAFPLQAGMLKDDRLGMAFSALLVALIYSALVVWLRKRRDERLLTEAYAALALGFATLAVPLAFSASTTASLWALEGAGAAWLGLRQKRNFPWLAGLGLQWLAAGAYCLSLIKGSHVPASERLLLLNADWLGAAILSFSGFALALIHDRHRPRFALPQLLFAWGALWWLVGGVGQFDLATQSLGEWRFATLYLSISIATAALLRDHLAWPRLNWLVAFCALSGVILVFAADGEYGAPLAVPTLLPWTIYLLAVGWALWSARNSGARSLSLAHLALLWSIALAATMQFKDFTYQQQLAQGWEFLGLVAPLALSSVCLWRRPAIFSWPRDSWFESYRMGWFGPAIVLLVLAFAGGLFVEGSPVPLAYLPVLNPLELALIGLAALIYGLFGEMALLRPVRRGWPLLAFAFATMATLRAVHHLHGEPWTQGMLDSGFSQTSLTVIWSLLGVGALVFGSRRRDRHVWVGGVILMTIVLAKLVVVDWSHIGNMTGIVSFLAVGLLLVGVGYIAPSPPKQAHMGDGA